jgi:hypothetical protein
VSGREQAGTALRRSIDGIGPLRAAGDELLEHALLYLAAQEDSRVLAERLGRDLG